MIDIMNVSTGRSFVSRSSANTCSPDGTPGFNLGLLGDVDIAAALGEALGVDAPLARLTRARWNLARERLGAGRDHSMAALGWFGTEEQR
jgi:hypothetical protein